MWQLHLVREMVLMRHGEVVARLPESELVDRFLQEIDDELKARNE